MISKKLNKPIKLEKKESELNQEERDMRKLDNGHLTAADRATLNQQREQFKSAYEAGRQAYHETTTAESGTPKNL